jgi:DNA-binding IclR family transcriptional regulator
MSESKPDWSAVTPATMLDALCCFARDDRPATLFAIAHELRIGRTQALHLLTALAADGRVVCVATSGESVWARKGTC